MSLGVGMWQGRRISSLHISVDAPRPCGLPAPSQWLPQHLLTLAPCAEMSRSWKPGCSA